MRLLELFSGTGSIGRVFRDDGWDVVSLDANPKTKACVIIDIREWDYKVYDPTHFDAIWASPCCTHYSCARRGAKTPRNLEWADSLVLKTLEIIRYFNTKIWFIENPQTGMLKDREFMKGLPYTDVDYCRYSDYGYKKRTRIWTTTSLSGLLCQGAGNCPNMVGRRHKTSAQQGRHVSSSGMYGTVKGVDSLCRIPPLLCIEILHHARTPCL